MTLLEIKSKHSSTVHCVVCAEPNSLLHDVMIWNTDKTRAGGNTMEKCLHFCILFEEVGTMLVFSWECIFIKYEFNVSV